MALSVTNIYAGGTTNGSTESAFNSSSSLSLAAVTPSNNSFLILFVGITGNGTYSNTGVSASGGPTWTLQTALSGTGGTATGYTTYIYAFTAPVTTGVSTAVTVSGLGSGTDQKFYATINQFTGYNTSTPTGATALLNNNGAAGGGSAFPTLTLSSAPASTSIVIAFDDTDPKNNSATAGPTANTSPAWTSLVSTDCSPTEYNTIGVAYISTTSTSIQPWSGLTPGDTHWTSALSAVEVLAAAGGETVTIDKWWQPPFYRPPKTDLVGY